MYGVAMYYSVKTLKEKGKRNSEIANILGIHRNTVMKLKKKIEKSEIIPERNSRKSSLEVHKSEIQEYIGEGLSAVLIHKRLKLRHDLRISYSTVRDYVGNIRGSECYIPLLSPPGQEAQVDFGYVGLVENNGKKVKAWVFCMTLSYSRYAYYELVLNQSTETFIKCHINAFEYFGGVPETVKIDNLKSAVLEASFYEPVLQTEYNNFLLHYNTAGVTCRVRRGQDKGKVESGIKYVKNNFIKGLTYREFKGVQEQLKIWTAGECNSRLHGTTRKIPVESFREREKEALKGLPLQRYEFFHVEKRTVNNYGHIFYNYNYYSVPFKYQGAEVTLKTNGNILKIYDYLNEIALHAVCKSKGEFITIESHKPPHKQKKDSSFYDNKALSAGEKIYDFTQIAKEKRPVNWQRILMGVLKLCKIFGNDAVNKACSRAIHYGAISSRSVRGIIENDLHDKEFGSNAFVSGNGFFVDLEQYDILRKGGLNA